MKEELHENIDRKLTIDSNMWYGIAGYAVAAGTSFFRIYNDRHWFSDVAMARE